MDYPKLKAYYAGAEVITNISSNLDDLWSQLLAGKSCLKPYENKALGISTFVNALELKESLNDLLALLLESYAQKHGLDLQSKRLRIYLSTTKGNIKESGEYALSLNDQSEYLQEKFDLTHFPKVISHACISGTLAIKEAAEAIEMGRYDEVLVIGYDPLCDFVLSGFQSFMALAPELCKPFDKNRSGINIGEVLALVHWSKNPQRTPIFYNGGAAVNDANHISGPSRNGEGLFQSIEGALNNGNIERKDLDYISAHGTATLFNDNMEAHAFHRAGLDHVPVNSLKAYFGHTLGAAGVIESIISLKCLEENQLLANSLYEEQVYDLPFGLNVIESNKNQELNHVLKCSSGFGGCNAAIIFSKE